MAYVVEVDLSAKVEQWSKNTAVAFSDGIQGSILIESSIKRAARDWLRASRPNRTRLSIGIAYWLPSSIFSSNPIFGKLSMWLLTKTIQGKRMRG
jgi:hypothetical protein